MEKKYEKPSMQVVVMNKQAQLLSGSSQSFAGFDSSAIFVEYME